MRKIFAAIIMMLFCFMACESTNQNTPTTLPFVIHKAGTKVTAELDVKEEHRYWFELQFWHQGKDDAERERIEKLVGRGARDMVGNPIDDGIPIPLKITISIIDASGERTVTEGEIFVREVWAGGGGHFDRGIGHILIPAGHCRISIQSINDIPELSDVKVTLEIRYQKRSKY